MLSEKVKCKKLVPRENSDKVRVKCVYLLRKMNFLDYLCGVYQICLNSRQPLTNGSASTSSDPNNSGKNTTNSATINIPTSKFYNYHSSVEDVIKETSQIYSIYSTAPRINEDKFHNSDNDVVPKTCGGDWVMRYSQTETNFNPWQFSQKFSHFELVPWRQNKKKIDLKDATGWEPFQLSEVNRQQLRSLQKFELARTKRLLKQKHKNDRLKRQVKVRLVFSMELHRKKMQTAKPRIESKEFSLANRQMYVYDQRCIDLSEHWGYFSQRQKSVDDLLVRNSSNRRSVKAIAWNENEKNEIAFRASSESVFKEVPCDKCRDRCVTFQCFN